MLVVAGEIEAMGVAADDGVTQRHGGEAGAGEVPAPESAVELDHAATELDAPAGEQGDHAGEEADAGRREGPEIGNGATGEGVART